MNLRFGSIEIRPATRQVFIEGRLRTLGARAFDLLLALAERRQRVVPKHELLDVVWPGLVVEENNLSVQISAVRRVLGPAVIATIPGRGYRFVAAAMGNTDDARPRAPQVPQAPAGAAPASASLQSASPAPVPSRPGNLAPGLVPLYGREADLRDLIALVQARPLTTLVGPSGVGKTALAQAAAHALRERWRDGAWFIELAPVTDPALVVPAVAQALRIALPAAQSTPGPSAASARDHLASVLASSAMLLVLDNCEHVVEAVGALAEAIVARAPEVRLLTTSQELLNVAAEKLYKLNPLALPAADGRGEADPAAALEFGAIRLFAERAQAGDPRFTLSADNLGAVADICRRLDGLPLAIELAAARVRLLGVQGLRVRLGERFRILTGGARTAMRRHQTLHTAIDWSHALLSAAEQAVLRRLGVFVGGFTLELALQVGSSEGLDEWAVLDALSGLADKSLVMTDASEPPRYRLLETTRAYALEKLAAAGETEAWIERHAREICELFERTEEARSGDEGTLGYGEFMRRLAPELDNARAALDGLVGRGRGEANLAVGLAGAAAVVFMNLGLSVEALSRLMALRARVDDAVDPRRAALFWHRFSELGVAGRLPQAAALDAAERAQHFYRTGAVPRRLFQALHHSALLRTMMGQWGEAQALHDEARMLEAPGWPAWLRSDRLSLQGWIHHSQQRFEQALAVNLEQQALLLGAPEETRALVRCQSSLCLDLNMMQRYEESSALARAAITREGHGNSGSMAFLWARLIYAQAFAGRIDDAWATMQQALPVCRRDGAVLWASGLMAVLLAERGRWADAARVNAASMAYARRAHMDQLPTVQRTDARVQELLAGAGFTSSELQRWWDEGMGLDEAAIAAICEHDELRLRPSGAAGER